MSSHSKHKKKKKGSSWGEKIIIAVIVLVIAWAVYSFSQPPPATTTTMSHTAPDFTLPAVGPSGLTGKTITLSSFRGKVVLLEFMLPSCIHCQNMAPILHQLYSKFGSQNVVFLSVAGSGGGAESANDVAKFMQAYQSKWVYVYDSSGSAFNMYGVTGTPTFFIIGKNGDFAATYQPGELSYATLDADLTRLTS
jgi:thiol-disulfide isomerase/thioredoxin